ncbi:MAG: tRNA (adenosine(37)-N6)-threonylcarbamoyltransferase complex dimerization subunit type 1 TsaB [Candidatus Ratteibacteria bacterium]|nr:tRNA (adenosine(37)-N6)-threonylcarbamoyltransferase complex dimerization subunit type 1 TsaB [Candidatus Ratteibacteria bacterium]
MKVLSIETTSEVCSVAYLEDTVISSEYIFRTPDTAGKLISVIDTVLKDNNCASQTVELLVVSYGPGLWTGIRLGMGVAKGIASGTNARIFCVGTMDSIFFGLKELKIPILCTVNAYRGNVYLSYFNGRFTYKKNYPVKLVNYDEVHRICSKKRMILTGPGIPAVCNKVKGLKNVVLMRRCSYPSAGINGLLAIEKIRRDIPSAPIRPFYGR